MITSNKISIEEFNEIISDIKDRSNNDLKKLWIF